MDYLQNHKNILNYNQSDILTNLQFHQIQLEDLTSEFKQETSLQQALNDLLPPKEVALTTIFLPQNSENIFEMPPSARINILKKVFGILGIDEAKKIIDENKTKTYGELKARENTSSFQERIFEILEKIKQTQLSFSIQELQNFLEDLELISADKLDLDKLKKLDINFQVYFDSIKQKLAQYQDFKKNIEFIHQQIQQIQQELTKYQQELAKIDTELQQSENLSKEFSQSELELQQLNEKISLINSKYENLQSDYEKALERKNQILNLQKQLEKLDLQYKNLLQNREKLQTQLQNTNNQELEKLNKELQTYNQSLEKLQDLDFDKFKFEDKQVENISQLKELILQVETEGKNYKLQIDKLTQQIQNIEENLKKLTTQSKPAEYFCKKINTNCPFIKDIQSKFDNSLKLLEEQKQQLQKQKQELLAELKQLKGKREYLANWWKQNNISQIKNQIKEIEVLQEKISNLHNQLKKYQDQQNKIMQAKGQLDQINKQLDEISQEKEKILQEINNLQSQIDKQIFEDYANYQKLQQQKEALSSKITNLSNKLQQTLQLQTYQKQYTAEVEKLKQNLEKLNKELEEKLLVEEKLKHQAISAQEDEKQLINLKELVGIFNDILEEYNQNKLKIQKIKKRYKILKDLSNIFGKELVIYVFSDYLKSLEELINYFI